MSTWVPVTSVLQCQIRSHMVSGMLTSEQATTQVTMDIDFEELGAAEAAKAAAEAEAKRASQRQYVKFSQLGDSFIGRYIGTETETKSFQNEPPKEVTLHIFENKHGKFAIEPSADLKVRLTTLAVGRVARITYIDSKPIEGRQYPMKIFKLEAAKPPSATPAPQAAFPF